ncbi:hypothetical protein BH10PSE11_BH10PSE11_40740 [soil metagenome]
MRKSTEGKQINHAGDIFRPVLNPIGIKRDQ